MSVILGESQLRVNDVYQEVSGIWVLDVNKNSPDKELKNISAERLVPISEHLLKTDFMEYHAYIKKTYGEGSLLWPYLIKGSNGYGKTLGGNFTVHKQDLIKAVDGPTWSRKRMDKAERAYKSLLVDEELKCFHSLRKNLGYAMKQAGYDLPVRKRILGHVLIDVTEDTYSGDTTYAALKRHLDAVKFDIDYPSYRLGPNWQRLMDKLMNFQNDKLRRRDARSKPVKSF